MINGQPVIRRVEWQVKVKPDGEYMAVPGNERPIRHYLLWDPKTKSARWKEQNQELVFLGLFNSINDALRGAAKLL